MLLRECTPVYMFADVAIWIIIALSTAKIHMVTQELALFLNTQPHKISARLNYTDDKYR